jgi:hypothetical protein
MIKYSFLLFLSFFRCVGGGGGGGGGGRRVMVN